MQLKLGNVIQYLCNNHDVPFFRDIHYSLNRAISSRCTAIKISQYLFHRRAGEKSRSSVEVRKHLIDINRLNRPDTSVIQCLSDLIHAKFYGIGIMDDRLFAIDISHDRDDRSIGIHCVPDSSKLRPSAWIRLAQKYLGMTTDNTSVVIIYNNNDITTVHGTRYPEFIEKGVDVQIQNGAIPLFWFIDNHHQYGRHLYLFIIDNQYFLNTLTLVRSREITTKGR